MTSESLRFDDPHLIGTLEAAIDKARGLGATHVEARVMRTRVRHVSTADRQLESAGLSRSSGFGVRLLVDGCWGFAGTSSQRPEDLDRAVRDLAYQSRTPDFWGSLVALGGQSTYVLGGALNCGKAQPGQVAAVSHGCPSAAFENVVILNATDAS